ncbi:MAG TPA: hypothetical protein VF228_01765 [Iamia sp.]
MEELTAVGATVVVAILAGLVAYLSNLRLARKTAQLERLNAQLEQLYGPLYAYSQSTAIAWKAFRDVYRPTGPYFSPDRPPTDLELKAWFTWTESVFHPANVKSAEIIRTHAHLLEGDSMPSEMLEFLAHVSGYEAALHEWHKGDHTNVTSLINYPPTYQEHVEATFQLLKRRQRDLLDEDLPTRP